MIASPNEHFDHEINADLESLPDLSNNDSATSNSDLSNNDSVTSNPLEPSLHSNQNRIVHTCSGRASRSPKHSTPDNSYVISSQVVNWYVC